MTIHSTIYWPLDVARHNKAGDLISSIPAVFLVLCHLFSIPMYSPCISIRLISAAEDSPIFTGRIISTSCSTVSNDVQTLNDHSFHVSRPKQDDFQLSVFCLASIRRVLLYIFYLHHWCLVFIELLAGIHFTHFHLDQNLSFRVFVDALAKLLVSLSCLRYIFLLLHSLLL